MPYRIFTDSSSNLPESLIEELELSVLPLRFMIDGDSHQSYLKGRKTDLKQFYTMMREGKVITTSLPNLGNAQESFTEAFEEGYDILYLGFSSGLSGTYEAMASELESVQACYPDRKAVSVDTRAASMGEGLLVYYAAKKKQQGASLDEVAQWVRDNRLHLAHWFTVDDLMYLFRGGRVSRTTAFAANLLSVKPVLHVDDEGHLTPVEKARGRKKSIKSLVDHMAETATGPVDGQTVFISHGDCLEDAEYLQKLIEERFGVTSFCINYVDPVIGAHSGLGTLALFFLASHR